MHLGFIGTGTITEATVRGLAAAWGQAHTVTVSPRSEDVSHRLAAEFAHVTRASTNQQVVDASDAVFLALRPEQLGVVCSALRCHPDQIVVSLLAGTTPAQVATAIAAPVRVCRATPLPMIAVGQGPIVLQDAPDQIAALFAPLGHVIIAKSNSDMAAFGVASGLMSSVLELSLAAVNWLAGRGIAPTDGRDYVLSLVQALSATALVTPPERFAALADAHETPGGLNENCRQFLTDAGAFALLQAAMTSTEAHGRKLAG